MPFKIYTYEDPYKLDQADFWSEISDIPHFCVARTLVNGLKDVLQDKIHGLICPIDNLVSFPSNNHHSKYSVYQAWTRNINRRIQQYSKLTSIFSYKFEQHQIDEAFFHSLQQNQSHFLDALRLFIELKISPASIDKTAGNKEQQLFVEVLEQILSDDEFIFPQTPPKDTLHDIIVEIAQNELLEYEQHDGVSQKERLWYQSVIETTKSHPLDAIVVHGIHQFSPVQLRLLLEMEKYGITIIFLFNYQKKYKNIYASWQYIYSCFNIPIHHDANIKEYLLPSMQNPSNALGCALGSLYEGSYRLGDQHFKSWYNLYKAIDYLEFANITEYAHFVSNHFDAAKEKYKSIQNIRDRGNDVWSNAAVLRNMDEQVYTANRDIHTLLKIYYPEFAQDRHFLSYPIGQFFSAIYRLWDCNCGKIKIDPPAIKECLNSDILSGANGEYLLKTFYNLEILFNQITTYEEFEEQIAKNYLKNYDKVISAKSGDPVFPLKQLSIYNIYKVTRKDICCLISAIREINAIASALFTTDNSRQDYINFGSHFQHLEDFLKQRNLDMATEEERVLINALQLRLGEVHPERSQFSGTFKDLQTGLHFYLKQKESEESVDWIVKNFEQIDGDILQSKRQFDRGEHKVYHFACLSDYDLNCHVDDLLPWPLNEAFIQKSYSPVDLQFQVYYSSLCERENFLRYALFYGLYFNYCDVRLSYVKQYNDEPTEPYSILPILGITPHEKLIEEIRELPDYSISPTQVFTHKINYNQCEMMSMFLCPYRSFLDYTLSDRPIIQGDFLYQQFYENLIIGFTWKEIGQKHLDYARKNLKFIIERQSKKLQKFFPFWKGIQIIDLEKRAENYLSHCVLGNNYGQFVKPYDEFHMSIRRIFGLAGFYVDSSSSEPTNRYSHFEALTSHNREGKKVYSLHAIQDPMKSASFSQTAEGLKEDFKSYLNDSSFKKNYIIPASWCTYCVHRDICLHSLLS